MSRFVTQPIAADSASVPFGTSCLPELNMGVELSSHGYVEEEYLLNGTASVWRHSENGLQEAVRSDVPFRTRVLLRRPSTGHGSGLLQVEPLHPDLDSALVWNAIHPWILRGSHSWMGVTVFAPVAQQLRDVIDPERYSGIDIPHDGMQYDVLASAIRSAIAGDFGPIATERVILGGMSATGSFCRVVLQDGFHERWSRGGDRRLIDGYVIGISSGGAGAAGYPPLSEHDPERAADDPRRTIDPHAAAAFEVLSETEAETHEHVTRADSDDTAALYRLYEIAATAHIEAHAGVLTNQQQFERRGGARPAFDVSEPRSDARFDLYLRGAFDAMSRWLTNGELPPRAVRFAHRVNGEELVRDADGNVLGGVRPPWVTVPTAAYAPHSTASAESERPPAWMPFSRPDMLARLVGSMRPFPLAELRERYGSRAAYLDRFAAAVRDEVSRGLLLEEDASELLRHAPQRWRG
ncbi:alpha/beta hydrolase domain-containing protein [Microbacterium sp. STN6]|uniref:alpha/beta hydrolase domain-containing protein n=1 Tax=Microbacterium sp. STN6 TaxID=2995588 RepID=UPI002260B63E|nr:alpha/beta hydrolase domain-containing protein [Microbacterium sp. STN6]MCX7520696.1 alpha/beta hydrolase domain-containing protein [Microbacterium sp. STN6]